MTISPRIELHWGAEVSEREWERKNKNETDQNHNEEMEI